MTHHDRLLLLADALRVHPTRVVSLLRKRDVVYYGPGGALLFASDWCDERIVAAAVHVFLKERLSAPTLDE